MADPRSLFRSRMPRLRPSVSSSRSIARKPPFQPEAPATPTPPKGGPPPSSTVVAPAQPVLPSSTAVAPAPIQPALPPPTQPAPAPPTQPAPAPPPPAQPTPAHTPAPTPSSTVVAPAQPVLPPPASTSHAPRTPVVPPASTTTAPAPFVLLPPPPPPPQDEPRSMPPPLPQAPPPSPVVSSFTKPATPKSPEPTKTESSQPFSPSQKGIIRSRVSSKPPSPSRMSTEAHVSSNPPPPSPSPSTTSQLTSQPSSPAVTTAKLQPKEHVPDIASHNDQKDVDLALNEVQEGEIQTTTETNEETFIEQPTTEAPKIKQTHQEATNTPTNIPETKSIIPQPMDAESLQNPKPIKKPEASTDVNKRDRSPRKQFFNEKPLSVITLAGDNRGTSMNINGAIKRESAIHIHRRYKVNPDEITDTMTDGEEISDGKKSERDSDDREKNAYINCNIQGINNSMVFNSSFAERNPGVHLGSNLESVDKAKWKKSKIMETDTNLPSEKITTIRRRCLRGFFMESSDSDADDPHKPRRHGCRYTGGEKMEVV